MYTTLDQILADLSAEPTNTTQELSAVDLDPLEFERSGSAGPRSNAEHCGESIDIDVDAEDGFSDGRTNPIQPIARKSLWAETTVRVDMPWLRAQLW